MLETARNGKRTFEAILQLSNEVDARIVTLGRRAENARRLVHHLYGHPIVTPNQAAGLLEISPRTARDLIQALQEVDVLTGMSGRQRYRTYIFGRYAQAFME